MQKGWKGEKLVGLLALIIASADFVLRLQRDGELTLGNLFISMIIFLVCYAAGWMVLNVYRKIVGDTE
jgi:hypothetical protein